jgi:outer membrane biosynthesis protein TonB
MIGSSGGAPVPLGREAIIQGGLDSEMISAVIQKNMGQVRFCYEQGLQGDPKLSGRVAINFIIGTSGLVKIADIGSTSLNSKIVEDCILLRLKSWKFPLPEGGVEVKVSYPFLLRRTGQG